MNERMVIEMVADVLSIDNVDKISMNSNLIDDLAAESIDFIDIMYRLETDFKLGKVAVTDIFPSILQQKESYENSRLKPDVVEQLEGNPHIQGEVLEELKSTGNYKVLFTLKNLLNFVQWKSSQVNAS